MSHHDGPRSPTGNDTFDDIFPADQGSRARAAESATDPAGPPPMRDPAPPIAGYDAGPARQSGSGAPTYDGRPVGSPPPPRGARMVLPWVIIGASALAIAIVGFMILRGQRTHPNTAATTPVVTRTVTSTPSPTSGGNAPVGPTSGPSSSSEAPAPATTPPPGFEKCSGTDTGYKVRGAGTTCAFVADVARGATARAATAGKGGFSFDATSAATGQTYTLECVIGPYINCTIPPSGSRSSPTYIDVMRN